MVRGQSAKYHPVDNADENLKENALELGAQYVFGINHSIDHNIYLVYGDAYRNKK